MQNLSCCCAMYASCVQCVIQLAHPRASPRPSFEGGTSQQSSGLANSPDLRDVYSGSCNSRDCCECVMMWSLCLCRRHLCFVFLALPIHWDQPRPEREANCRRPLPSPLLYYPCPLRATSKITVIIPSSGVPKLYLPSSAIVADVPAAQVLL